MEMNKIEYRINCSFIITQENINLHVDNPQEDNEQNALMALDVMLYEKPIKETAREYSIETIEQKPVKKSHTLYQDCILASSWGYEQTNVNFYQVIKTSDKCVWVKEINKVNNYDSKMMVGTCVPVANSFVDPDKPPMRKTVINHGEDYIKIESFESAYIWDGKPQSFTSYA